MFYPHFAPAEMASTRAAITAAFNATLINFLLMVPP
jgi:hypothetical protein